MKIIIRYSFAVLFLLFTIRSFAQQIGIGDWRDELPYYMCISVTEGDSRIYSATPYALFYFDKSDNSIMRLNKINGLSDIGISTINYSKEYQTLVIAYENANIDLLRNNTIINISDIKRASILGDKTINNIYFIGKYAYLSCGFGIVVLDIDKEEIHDTYYIGQNGGQVNVLGLTKNDQDTLFAATEKGIYLASASDPNLANYESWSKDKRMDTNSMYNTIATFSGEVVVNRHVTTSTGDSLFRFKDGRWTSWAYNGADAIGKIQASNGYLCVTYSYYVRLFGPTFDFQVQIYDYFPGNPYPLDAIVDKDKIAWIGDTYSGLVSDDLVNLSFSKVQISGPLTSKAFSMSISGNDLYVAPGGRDNSFTPLYNQGQVYHFDNTDWWNSASQDVGGAPDIVTIAIDPADSKHIFAGSWGKGLVEMENGVMVAKYGESNSTLHHHSATTDTSDIRVGGTAFDQHGNLWVVNSHNNNCLSMKSGSTWTGFNISKANENDLAQLMVDRNDQKWILMRYSNLNTNSILIFTDNGTPEDKSDDQSRLLNSNEGSGHISGNYVYAIAEDRNGQVWVGTENGISVFYNPENMFVAGQNIDAQQILVQQGSYVQYLLEGEMVTAIAVDGANQKWIGTDRGGVFLFSPDGTKQIYHFTVENSPMFSDRITALAINPITGEVFIGTDKGILSFKSIATEGGDTFSDVYAYPNPVKSGYTGYIAIKGLVQDAEVKITDISGRLIYSTKAAGGQAIWDGKNFSGRRAKTGVYLVFASNSDGSEKVVTKILIIN